jgi:hypothetical protein
VLGVEIGVADLLPNLIRPWFWLSHDKDCLVGLWMESFFVPSLIKVLIQLSWLLIEVDRPGKQSLTQFKVANKQ